MNHTHTVDMFIRASEQQRQAYGYTAESKCDTITANVRILQALQKSVILQFRIGTHTLPVNNGKHFNVPRADRHCRNCDKSVMGDEIHFLYECTKLNNLRIKCMD